MPSLIELVRKCDCFPYSDDDDHDILKSKLIPFTLFGRKIGLLFPDVVEKLKEYNSRFLVKPFDISEKFVTFEKGIDTLDKRTAVIKQLVDTWREEDAFTHLRGWRDELYPVYGDPSNPDNIAFVIERAASSLFGIYTFGVHLNAYTRTSDGKLKMWIGKRASNKPSWPGWLDNAVAGGIAYTHSAKQTLIKEAMEEASLPGHIAEKAQPVGAITYFYVTQTQIQPETQYIYDLELPVDIVPKPNDDEVECFYLWDLNELEQHLRNGEFKPNCGLVVIDFLVRHGVITPDNEPDYLELLNRLHRRLGYPGPSKITE